MRELTDQAQHTVQDLAQRYGTSTDAVRALLQAVVAGGGTMAQFSHPDLGGSGQWMSGGMTMVSDMFNHGLQAKVSGLCAELSNFIATQPAFVAPAPSQGHMQWNAGYAAAQGNMFWPAELGQPSATGGQNDFRYAYFPGPRRLVVERAGQLSIYDTLDHQIGGVSQQQSGAGGSFTFSSQRGTFSVESLPLVQPAPPQQPPPAPMASAGWSSPQAQSTPDVTPPSPPTPPPAIAPAAPAPAAPPAERDEIFSTLDRLGDLRDRGILTDDEFLAKKTELLARL